MNARTGLDADVIVVGAGPAGAAAAARLAGAGADVLLVDRSRFPRDKVCGDFVGPVARAELDALGVRAGVEGNPVDRAALYVDGEELITYALPEYGGRPGAGSVVPRVQLDDAIVAAARRAGARVLEETTVSSFVCDADGVELSARSGGSARRLRARALVGADGSSSTIARAVRGAPASRRDFMVAVRAYYDGVAGPADRCDLAFRGDSFPGYAWIFPTAGGTANVGVGTLVATYPARAHHLRELLDGLVRRDPAMRARLGSASLRGRVAGWPLAIGGGRTSPVADRVVLVGDAAGLVNPLNGEGIQSALLSARWAAQTLTACLRSGDVSRRALRGYAELVHRELGRDMLLASVVVRAIANRALNPLWLAMLRAIVARAAVDERYALATGGVVAGVVPARMAFTPSMLAATATCVAAALARRAGGTLARGPGAAAFAAGCVARVATETVRRPQDAAAWMADVARAARDALGSAKGDA
jgi:geranylgeranyl reductase family protein